MKTSGSAALSILSLALAIDIRVRKSIPLVRSHTAVAGLRG